MLKDIKLSTITGLPCRCSSWDCHEFIPLSWDFHNLIECWVETYDLPMWIILPGHEQSTDKVLFDSPTFLIVE